MFPIRNVKGECIGFGGRVLGDEKPKYLNSPETPVFSKGRELYGLFEARNALREQGYVLVTEGYMDVVALAQLGFPNAVATLGTACTPEHVQKLFRFTDAVVFSFDGDAAGRRAARKALDGALPYATDVRTVKFLFLPRRARPGQLHPRVRPRRLRALRAARPCRCQRVPDRCGARGLRPGHRRGPRHMAAMPQPLWTLLPDGALKRQLLGEIASAGAARAARTGELWARAAARPAPAPRRGAATPRRRHGSGVRQPPSSGRTVACAEHHRHGCCCAMPTAWERLTAATTTTCCASCRRRMGDLFAWLDSQVHEHGAPALGGRCRSAWQGQPSKPWPRS